ncbi:MAG: succinylglutamate desuccinylase/aspartoacylase family protein [Pseudomonadota bacterium]
MRHFTRFFALMLAVTAVTAFGNENVVGSNEPLAADEPVLRDGFGLFTGQTFEEHGPLELLGEKIPPGSYRQLTWSATQLFEGLPVDTPVLVVHGRQPGPVLCLTAAVHGDELNGIEIVRRVLHGLQPSRLGGTVIGVPIVNIQGFRRGTRYLPDRRDLNRHFPGSTSGSAASRIASSFFNNIVLHCDALVDLHTGSFERTNLPQLRADLSDESVTELAQGFGATVIVNSRARSGTLRYAATVAGVPTVTLEAGGPGELESLEVTHGVKGVETLMHNLRMVVSERPWTEEEETYLRSAWVRADRGGILIANVELGSRVTEGDLLGRVTDPITNDTIGIYAPLAGRIIGMARNQVVMPGFAAFHLGISRPSDNDVMRSATPQDDDDATDKSE